MYPTLGRQVSEHQYTGERHDVLARLEKVPFGVAAITGRPGSGKSTLAEDIILAVISEPSVTAVYERDVNPEDAAQQDGAQQEDWNAPSGDDQDGAQQTHKPDWSNIQEQFNRDVDFDGQQMHQYNANGDSHNDPPGGEQGDPQQTHEDASVQPSQQFAEFDPRPELAEAWEDEPDDIVTTEERSNPKAAWIVAENKLCDDA
ncbi:hypothetical protein FPSE5266_20296 [Fusarium pseudograminearum]|nr:hypothetical protein FPSE5266_20296 [Fusarium pseudograminearum]